MHIHVVCNHKWNLHFECLFQTVLAFVMGTTLYVLAKKVGTPIAEMLDARSQVGYCNGF